MAITLNSLPYGSKHEMAAKTAMIDKLIYPVPPTIPGGFRTAIETAGTIAAFKKNYPILTLNYNNVGTATKMITSVNGILPILRTMGVINSSHFGSVSESIKLFKN